MKQLRAPYQFATDGNYVAPSTDWDGAPRILVPSSPLLAAGWTPDTPVPTEYLNYLESIKADALTVQNHAALQSWRMSQPLTTAGGGTAGSFNQILGMRVAYSGIAPANSLRRPVSISYHPSTFGTAQAHSCDGSYWEAMTDTSTAYTPNTNLQAGVGAANELFLFGQNSTFLYSGDAGNTWAIGPTTFDTVYAMHYMQDGGGVNKYFKYTSNGGVWVYNIALSAVPTYTTVPLNSGGVDGPNGAFADNGAGILLLAAQPSGLLGGTHTYSVISRSLDYGASFANVLTLPANQIADLIYSKYWGLFIIMTSNGNVYTSADGAAWNTLAAGSTSAVGFKFGAGTIACAGSALVKLWSSALSGSHRAEGIAYSFNLGLNWNFAPFGAPATPTLTTIRGFNNRIYAAGVDYVWTSGALGCQDAEI